MCPSRCICQSSGYCVYTFCGQLMSCALQLVSAGCVPRCAGLQAVSNVVGRAELLAAVLFFLALLCYRRAICAPRYASSLGSAIAATTLAAAAMLAKEQGVTALGVCAAYDVLFGRARICTHPAAAQRHASCSNLRQAYRCYCCYCCSLLVDCLRRFPGMFVVCSSMHVLFSCQTCRRRMGL